MKSAPSRSKTGAVLTTAVVLAVVVVAFVLAGFDLSFRGSPPISSSSSSTADVGLISRTSTGQTTRSSANSSATYILTSTTTSLTRSPTSYIIIPFGVGSNESLSFQPPSITVVVGVNNTIVWNDTDAEQHTVTSMGVPQGAAKFDSGILNQGQTFTLTLTVPGTYRYYCTIHPTWMRGTIIVKP